MKIKDNRRVGELEPAYKLCRINDHLWEYRTKVGLPQETRGGKETENKLARCVQGQENYTSDPRRNHPWVMLTLSAAEPRLSSSSGVPSGRGGVQRIPRPCRALDIATAILS